LPWQSSLLPSNDISITKKPPRRKQVHAPRNLVAEATPSKEPFDPAFSLDKQVNVSSTPTGSILILGDSHVEYGVDFGAKGWLNHLRRSQNLISVLNLGASGYNTKHALDHVSLVAQKMLHSSKHTHDIKHIMLMYGSIDSYRKDTIKQTMRVEPDDYQKNLETLAHALLQAGPEIPLLIVSPPAPNDNLMRVAWTQAFEGPYDNFCRFKSVEETVKYQESARKAADNLKKHWGMQVRFADAFNFSMEKLTENDYQDDGLHLNALGNEKFHGWLERYMQ